MASESDIRAGRAFVELFVKTDPARTKAAVAQTMQATTSAAASVVSRADVGEVSGNRMASAVRSIGAAISRSLGGLKQVVAATAEGMAKVGEATEHLNQALEKLGPTATQIGAAIATMAGNTVSIMHTLGVSFAAIGQAFRAAGVVIMTYGLPVVAILAAIAAAVGVAYAAFKIFEPAIKLVWGAFKTLAAVALFPIVAFYKMSRAVVSSVVFMVTLVPRLIGAIVSAVRASLAFMWRAVTQPGKTLVQPLVSAFAWARDRKSVV